VNSTGPPYYCNAGATGLVGSRLVSRLSAQGHTVRVLTRNPDRARSKLPYARLQFFNIGQQLPDALKGATGVVNLAGETQFQKQTSTVAEQVATHVIARHNLCLLTYLRFCCR